MMNLTGGDPENGSFSGFTLFEVLVSVAVIAIVFTAVFRMHGATVMMERAAIFYQTAPELARMKMAEVALGALDEESGEFEAFPGYAWNLEVEEVSAEGFSGRLKRVDLAVTLDDRLRYDCRKYMFDPRPAP